MFDTPYSTIGLAAQIVAAGHGAVIRYISPDTENFPNKQLTLEEAQGLTAAGIWIAGVWEKMGDLAEMTSDIGTQHGTDASAVYQQLGAPSGSIIFLAVDFDATPDQVQNDVLAYFIAAHAVIKSNGYRVGVYGSKLVTSAIVGAGYADVEWLAGAYDWGGESTRDAIASGAWDILQEPQKASVAGLDVDLDQHQETPQELGFWMLQQPT